jgi:hypothetical protein
VLLTASPLPANAVGVEYEFIQKTYNTGTGSYTSTTVRASGAGNTYTWTPPTAQAYWMTVVARDTQSNEVTSDELYFRADDALITSANLQIINNGNGTYTLVASSTGGASNVQYRFVANIPVAGTSPVRYDAFVMQNYSTSNTMIWKPSAAALGKTLKLLVYARVVGSTANFQKVSPMRTLAL